MGSAGTPNDEPRMNQGVPIVVMGISGAGKTTVGKLLARALGREFIDADDLHDAQARAQMARGIPLTDTDRAPWLDRVGQAIARSSVNHGTVADAPVTACSALKRAYRDRIREYAPSTVFVELTGAAQVILARVQARTHAYMPPELLDSQLETLETLGDDERGIRISVDRASPGEAVAQIREWLGC